MAAKPYVLADGSLDLAHPSFEKALRVADLTGYPDDGKLNAPLDQAFWALWVLQDHFGHHRHVSAMEVSRALECRGIALTELQVERALARADARVSRKRASNGNGKTVYKLMQKGKDFLGVKYAQGDTRALIVGGSQPWTDRHVSMPEIARELKGRVCVLDKFYGSASLGILHHFRHAKPLQFLTAQTNESHATFLRELKDFKRECPSIEVRIYPHKHELHDRYVLAGDAAIIVGHGIKDLGNKESFIVVMRGDVAADLRTTLLEKFDERWAVSATI